MEAAVRQLVGERPVVIFSKSCCCVSYSMKQLIASYGANPTVHELDEIPNGRDIERALQSMGCKPTVPVVFIGQKFVGGANELISLQVRGKLVPMLMEAGAIWVWNTTSASASTSTTTR
ncbi:Monothiol glutaredoxin-S1 [Dionaea muscipula]